MSQDETVREQVRMAPLSLVQERIWHHSQRDPESPLWRVVIAFRLIGPATGARIESAFGRILDRHPLLSCRFQGSADGGATCIPTAGSPSLVEEDLTTVDQEDLDSELQWYLSDMPIRLTQANTTCRSHPAQHLLPQSTACNYSISRGRYIKEL